MIHALIIVVAILLWCLKDFFTQRECPPGPVRFPIVGNFLQVSEISRRTSEAFTALSEKYGDIMSIRLGFNDYIVLSNPRIIRDVQTRPEIPDRNTIDAEDRNMNQNNLGITWSNGENWKVTRNFTIHCFRKFGFSRSTDFDIVILDEFQKLKENILKAAEDKTHFELKLKPLFVVFALNIIWKYATGRQFSYEDSDIREVIYWSDKQVQNMTFGTPTNVFPVLRRVIRILTGGISPDEKLLQFITEQIKISETTYEEQVTPKQNFLDLFLQQMKNPKGDSTSFSTRENLMVTLLDIFQGGTLGTSGTLNFAIWYLMLNPEVQRKIQIEIDENIPRDTLPSLADKNRMSYTEATILEVFRMGTVFPIPVARKVIKDFKYSGFLFKKGVLVISNFRGIMLSKAIWGDPENFRPERFLKPNGEIEKTLSDIIIPFGQGERRCIGDRLSTATIFLTLVSLLRDFSFSPVFAKSTTNRNHLYGMTMSPHPYNTCITLRNFESPV